RAVDPHCPRQATLTNPIFRHRPSKAVAEQGRTHPFVDSLSHAVIYITNVYLLLRIFIIPTPVNKA
ncbi:MAG: hypothetical protein KGH84_03380, partial [Paracoccaceae bacterium]|nr:hypothetical protein [Paracoccaceae bacterium]